MLMNRSVIPELVIQQGLIKDPKQLIEHLNLDNAVKACSSFVIISDTNVKTLVSDDLMKGLLDLNLKCLQITYPAGEKYKTRETKADLEDQMLRQGLGADTCLIAVGGGVTTDIGGFLASTYCRGIPFINIPTTLLAMVDASIGGKNGVNTPFGKNLIGSVYQPKKIILDTDCLKTLPLKDLKDGFVEVIKHALIIESGFFEYLTANVKGLLTRDSTLLEKVILESCCIKMAIVNKETTNKGIRNLLNFGHTVGHSLENVTNYSLSHGEAVAIGILAECHIAVQLGKFNIQSLVEVQQIFQEYGLPLKVPNGLSIEAILTAMTLDKKSVDKTPRFAIIEEIGTMSDCGFNYCTTVDKSFILNSLEWIINNFNTYSKSL
jgi:3-dehydroquinate synthase